MRIRRVKQVARSARARPRPDDHQLGDKIGVKVGSRAGSRGRVTRVRGDAVVVEMKNGEAFVLPLDGITNYSRAARRAWQVMPKRAGRPRSDYPKKKMVSLRLDIELIHRLDAAVRLGRTANRSQAVAHGVAAYLDRLGLPRIPNQSQPPVEKQELKSTHK